MVADLTTRRWCRNASDELAIANGCWFDEAAGDRVIRFFTKFLRLYEGEAAGLPFVPQDWQADFLMRAFGWQRHSETFRRDVRRFRKVRLWTPKKNGKSPLAAGVTAYLLIADKEPGQKVYGAARDKGQAKIVWRHVAAMIRRSQALNDVCRIRESDGEIDCLVNDGLYKLLSGENIEGQEGLNGSVVIDELHVIDERLAETLENADSSRAQAMELAISTAGNDLESYGYREKQYGESVERGDQPDDSYLHVCYEAPQDATDDDLRTKPAIWTRANPSWGFTIDETEFRNKLIRASRQPSSWARFKRYRLNIWVPESNEPLVPMHIWHGHCREQFSETDLHGRDCYLGLDLARSLDMAAAVFVFGDDGDNQDKRVARLWPLFWYPENLAKEENHKAPFMNWAESGALRLSPEDTIEQDLIFDEIERLSKLVNIRGCIYDKTYAGEFVNRLQGTLGIYCQEFRQTSWMFASPTAEFQRMALTGRIRHNGHPIMSWEVGHAAMVADRSGNKRVVKPKDRIKKVDGVIAAIMGLAGFIDGAAGVRSYYEDNEIESA